MQECRDLEAEVREMDAVLLDLDLLLSRARDTVKKAEADGDDELRMLCVRTRKHELLLCSEADGAFAVCVVQDPTPASADEANVVGAAKSQAAKAVLRGGSVLGQPSTGVTL